ncbi:MAG: cation:proton antiporter [Lentisphaerae bacterium]|nr:cation:proton antiporter [Lentisphaerota bacterium]
MHVHDFFLQLVVILLAARILGELAGRLRAPPVIGELLAGVLIGPSLFGLMEPTDIIKLLAEIGIILLLFEVGLETDIGRLVKTGWKPILVAATGFVLPFVLGYGTSRWLFGLPVLAALFIGGTLTATSIGITVRVLADLKRQQSNEAQVVLGAAVLDDVLGVILLAVLYEFAKSGGVSLVHTGKVMGCIGVFLVLAPVAAKTIAENIKRFDQASTLPGLLPTTIVSLLLFFAWVAHKVGAPQLLGGFAAGLALSRYFFLPFGAQLNRDPAFAQKIEHQMRPIVHLFTPIFFVMVGLSLNLREVDWGSLRVWGLAGTLLVAATAGKLVAGCLVRGESPAARWAIGLAMIPRGEVGLIFAELGKTTGIFDQSTYAALLIVIALTTLVPPFLLRWFYGSGPGRALPA